MLIKEWQKSEFSFLDSIGIRWPGETDLDGAWQENANIVKEFQKKKKRLPSWWSNDPEEKRLGRWGHTQRATYKGKIKQARPLTLYQISFLESIPGWKWETNLYGIWQENANLVKEFQENNKRFPNPRSKDPEEKRLGNWCRNQKVNYNGKGHGIKPLTQEQISFLESMTGWKWAKNTE